jgi:flagellar motor switch protein FliN/FliY
MLAASRDALGGYALPARPGSRRICSDDTDTWEAAMHDHRTDREGPPTRSPHGGGGNATDDATAPRIFSELDAGVPAQRSAGGVDRVQDLPVELSVELGQATVRLRDLLRYAAGTVIPLDRLAGEPVDVLINGRLVAQGEVVTVNAKRGVRLTDVVGPDEPVRRST